MNQQISRSGSSTALMLAALFALPITSRAQSAPTTPPAPTMTAAAPSAGQASDEVVVMIADVQANMDTKQYPAAVKIASKLLALHGPQAVGVDRFEISMQKGYAHAGMKSAANALVDFKAAMKETKDPRQLALVKWTIELFRVSNGAIFVPKTTAANTPKRGPFDLIDPDQRKQAFGALLDDNLTLLEPKLKTATISQKLAEIYPVLQQVIDLDQLDQIANANDDKTSNLASGLLDHSKNLLSNALKSNWARVGDIDAHANIVTTVPSQVMMGNSVMTQTVSKKNGLSDDNKKELNTIISVSQKIHEASNAFLAMAKSDKDWTTLISDSDRVASRASDVLNADYGVATSTGSTVTGGYDGTGVGLDNTPYNYPTNTTPTTTGGGGAANTGTTGPKVPAKPVTPATPATPATPTPTPSDPATPPTSSNPSGPVKPPVHPTNGGKLQ